MNVSEQDVDPRDEKFAEIQVAALFGTGILALLFFMYAYFGISIHDKLGQYSNYALGGSLAIALLAVGLLAGGSLFFLLATRSETAKATIDISPPQPTPCAVGGHAPVCYSFIVTNIGKPFAAGIILGFF